MNLGLLNKSMREAVGITLGCATGLMLFEAFAAYVFWTYQEELTGDMMQIEFLQNMINSFVGGRMGNTVGPGTLSSLAWVHPLVLSMLFAVEITLCTRVPAGEIDRGTIDILFALPVSRWQVYLAESITWLAAGLVLMIFAFVGSSTGSLAIPVSDRAEPLRLLFVLSNLYALYLCVGGYSFLMSALSDRRGRAVGAIVSALLTLFLWSFLSQYWKPADAISFLNILSYFKPMPILDEGLFPFRNVGVLLACAVPLWVAGGVVLSRRDVCTV